MVTGSKIDPSQSVLCLCVLDQQVDCFVFNRFNKLLGFESRGVSDIHSLEFITQPFSKIWVSMAQQNFTETIVPKALFVESEASSYLTMIQEINAKQSIEYQDVSDNVYVCPSIEKKGFLSILSPQARVFPERYYLLKGLPYYQSKYSQAIVLHKRMHYIDVLYYEKDTVNVFNSFSVEHENDIAYYILLIYNQYSLDQKRVPVITSGETTSLIPAIEILKMYIKTIEPISFLVETDLQNMEKPFVLHSPIISSVLCE